MTHLKESCYPYAACGKSSSFWHRGSLTFKHHAADRGVRVWVECRFISNWFTFHNSANFYLLWRAQYIWNPHIISHLYSPSFLLSLPIHSFRLISSISILFHHFVPSHFPWLHFSPYLPYKSSSRLVSLILPIFSFTPPSFCRPSYSLHSPHLFSFSTSIAASP